MNTQILSKNPTKINPFDLGDRLETLDELGFIGGKEIIEYAIALEKNDDFDLEDVVHQFHINQLSFVRNGLALAKVKSDKIYKNIGDGTFVSFCKQRLRKSRRQVNDIIAAARVTLELLLAKFEVVPANISQAIALKNYSGQNLIETWAKVLDIFSDCLHEITYKGIRDILHPRTHEEVKVRRLEVPSTLHQQIHATAAELGFSIPQLLQTVMEFFQQKKVELLPTEESEADITSCAGNPRRRVLVTTEEVVEASPVPQKMATPPAIEPKKTLKHTEAIAKRDRICAEKIASGAVFEAIANSPEPISAVEIACELEMSVPIVKAECDRLSNAEKVECDRQGNYQVKSVEKVDIGKLRSLYRQYKWDKSSFEEYLFSYHDIEKLADLSGIDLATAKAIEQDLANIDVKEEFVEF